MFYNRESSDQIQPMPESTSIESYSNEARLFPPPPDFAANAEVKSFAEYEALYAAAEADPEAFWAEQAEKMSWFRKWDKVLEWNEPHAKWFVGGKINISYNCLDCHGAEGSGAMGPSLADGRWHFGGNPAENGRQPFRR